MTIPAPTGDPSGVLSEGGVTIDVNSPAGMIPGRAVRVERKDFNRSFLDLHDPLENVGYNASAFDVSSSFPIGREALQKVIGDLYDALTYKVEYGTIPDARVRLIDYNDMKTGNREPPRRYVLIERETTRKTHTSIYATFQAFGDNLYVGVDAFILGPLDIFKLITGLVVALGPLFLLIVSQSNLLFCLFIPALLFAAWMLRGPLLNLARGDTLEMAIRKRYNKVGNLGTFNIADILMFYQSVLPMVLNCMIEVFKKHDLPTDVLEGYIQKISYVTNITNDGGTMNIVDSAIGTANRVMSNAAARK